MGLSASQARFLELTARKSNTEYEMQRICFERSRLADAAGQASSEYQEKMSNRKLVFTFNAGDGKQNVDITYNNYKLYMNQQLDGLTSNQNPYYLVSSSGNKIIVASENDIAATIAAHPDDNLTYEDFMIVDNLDDNDNFQNALIEGIYYFAQRTQNETDGSYGFSTESLDTLGNGVISEVFDTSDDAAAQAAYDTAQSDFQSKDKKLELRLNNLETERDALKTEMDAVSKVMEDNIEATFKVFS